MLSLKNYNNTNFVEDKKQRKKIQDYSYALSDKIGKGYSSVVYKGRNDLTGQTVAVKVIDIKAVKDDFGRQMLDCEIQALKTISHPNVLKCYDVFTTANNCYIITELCNQGDLSQLLKKKKKFTQNEISGLIRDICQGFFEIASCNFLHRDLKLANIFLKDGVAKIADFGFAKKNSNTGQREKYNVGSPLYMPIQSLRSNMYSVKSDIWSVGIIIYQMLHGQTPWECKTENELMERMTRVPVVFKTLVSNELRDFIGKCLQIDQNRRFSLQQMRDHPLIHKLYRCSDIGTRNDPQPKIKVLDCEDFDKENIQCQKATFDQNNQRVLQYINTFRLLYKITCELKKQYPTEKNLIQIVSGNILVRINGLEQLSLKPNIISSNNLGLNLKNIQMYFNPVINPSIKKYVHVIDQYSRRYNYQLQSSVASSSDSLETALVHFLKVNPMPEKGVTLFYWITQYLTLPTTVKRASLEAIVDSCNTPSPYVILSKIQKLIQ